MIRLIKHNVVCLMEMTYDEKLEFIRALGTQRENEPTEIKTKTRKEKPVPFTGQALLLFEKLPPELRKGLL